MAAGITGDLEEAELCKQSRVEKDACATDVMRSFLLRERWREGGRWEGETDLVQ